MLRQAQVIKRFNELETTARRIGLSLAATDTTFVLRQRNDEVWRRCVTLDEVEIAIQAYVVASSGRPSTSVPGVAIPSQAARPKAVDVKVSR